MGPGKVHVVIPAAYTGVRLPGAGQILSITPLKVLHPHPLRILFAVVDRLHAAAVLPGVVVVIVGQQLPAVAVRVRQTRSRYRAGRGDIGRSCRGSGGTRCAVRHPARWGRSTPWHAGCRSSTGRQSGDRPRRTVSRPAGPSCLPPWPEHRTTSLPRGARSCRTSDRAPARPSATRRRCPASGPD